MKYFIQTILIVFGCTTGQFAQVNVTSSTGNVSIGSLASGSHKLTLYGPMSLRHPNTTDLGFIRFANSSNSQLGFMQFTNPANINDVDFQIETDFGDIEIDAKQELRFLVNDAVTAEIRSNGMYLKSSDYLGWDEGATRKAYMYYNGQNLFLENDEIGGDVTLDAEGRITFNIDDSNRMVIDEVGNVGIGTTSPHQKFTVNGNVALGAGNSYGFYESSVLKAGVAFNGTDMFMTNLDGAATIIGETHVAMNVNGVEHMRVALSGNVGINQVAPTERLHIDGGIRLGNAVGNANGTIRFNGSDLQGRVGGTWVSLTAAGGGLWGNSGNNAFYTAGNVGIGTSSPAHKLQVNGDIGMTGEIIGVSDVRTKKEINAIGRALETLNSLKPVSYTFDATNFDELDLPEGKQFGFIAQELEAVLPELVSTSTSLTDQGGKSTSLKGINYIQLIPLLTQAIQDQHALIQQQEEELDIHANLLAEQTKQIKDIQAQLNGLKK